MFHPAHAAIVARTRHRELVAQAEQYRYAAQSAAPHDCRIPVGPRRGCRFAVSHGNLRRRSRNRPAGVLRGHRRPRHAR